MTFEDKVKKISFITEPLLRLSGGVRVCLVGGTVRDMLMCREIFDIDIVVEGDTKELSKKLCNELGGIRWKYLERFGTASFEVGNFRIDFARARREKYPYPGALPEIEFIDNVEQDLPRRDFTINAIAWDIKSKQIIDLFDGVGDIERKKIKVLHKMSISDDPTRIFRAVRFSLKFSFEISGETMDSLRVAFGNNAFANVSGDRFLAEMKLAGAENFFARFVKRLQELDVMFHIFAGMEISDDEFEELRAWEKEVERKVDEKTRKVELKLAKYFSFFRKRSEVLGHQVFERMKLSKRLRKLAVALAESENAFELLENLQQH